MSTKSEEKKELEKEVVSAEGDAVTEMMIPEEVEDKKTKAKRIGKKILKVALLGGVGLFCYNLGKNNGRKAYEAATDSTNYDGTEVYDVEVPTDINE